MDVQGLSQAMGGTLSLAKYKELLPHYENAAIAAGCTTHNRAAMWAAQIGHESVGLKYMEEIASGVAYNGRQDLGNIYPGDGPRFKGRGPIQLTGRNNYRAFTNWCRRNGHSNLDFEANPQLVSQPKWGFLAATYYWDQNPGINTYADKAMVKEASAVINGWFTDSRGNLKDPNGLQDRLNRWNRCIGMGDRILPGEVPASTIYHPMRDEDYRVSSGYGNRAGGFHAGLDFAADYGTAIYAPTDGVVVQGKDRPSGTVSGFGNWVWIDAQPEVGKDFIFGHMRHSSILVSRGDRVRAGQKIAEVASEGQSSGPHLHFEVWGPPGRLGGSHEDPAVWLEGNVNDGNPEHVPNIPDEPESFLEELMSNEITSLVNPKKSFPAQDAVAFIDRCTWENRVLLKALLNALGMDPEKIINDAIVEDRAK